MADYGLRIVNANGYVQIDGNYSNMALSTSGVLSFAGAEQLPNGVYYQVLTVYGVSPVIALKSTGGSAAILGSGGNANSGVYQFGVMCTTRDPVTYYVFDDARLAAKYNTNYGLIVRNQYSGNVVFDSRSPYLRVLGTMSGDRTNNATPFPMTAQFGSNYDLAVIQTMRVRNDTYFALPGFPPLIQPVSSGSFSKVSSNIVTLSESVIWTYAPDPNNPTITDISLKFLYFIIDVSGF